MKSMGGVAVLHPQDSHNNHHPDNLESHRSIRFNPSYTNTRNFTVSDGRRRTQPPRGILNNNNRYAVGVQKPAATASMNQSYRVGSDPDVLSKQMKKYNTTEFFAGSAFVDSPPPSSVPIPGFFTKSFTAAGRDDPTTELRRILGLSLS